MYVDKRHAEISHGLLADEMHRLRGNDGGLQGHHNRSHRQTLYTADRRSSSLHGSLWRPWLKGLCHTGGVKFLSPTQCDIFMCGRNPADGIDLSKQWILVIYRLEAHFTFHHSNYRHPFTSLLTFTVSTPAFPSAFTCKTIPNPIFTLIQRIFTLVSYP